MLEENKYYRCQSCGRTYRCLGAGKPISVCGHALENQREITKDEYRQIRMSCYRNRDQVEKQNKQASEAAAMYGIPVSDKDDAISIFGKAIRLNKRQVIRLFSEMGWQLYHRRWEKVRAKAQDGSLTREDVDNTPPTKDDLDFFNKMELIVALARGMPHSLQMNIHPKFQEYTHFFSLAIYQFAYCYPLVNACSQEGLCWLFNGFREVLVREGEKELALLEAEEILREQRGGGHG